MIPITQFRALITLFTTRGPPHVPAMPRTAEGAGLVLATYPMLLAAGQICVLDPMPGST